MRKRVGMEVSLACSEAARLSRVDVVSAYPITPQTHIVERLAEMVAKGQLDAEFLCVESEHSAMSACLGSSAVGARVFTATAGQGLELMHEVLYVASASRLPIVMIVANRALSAPLNVWGDHSDVMAVRDTGWIQYFAENGQEAFDLVPCAFKIAENRNVLLPVMVHMDGFHLTHVVESLYLMSQEEVDSYLPPYEPLHSLNPDKPVTMGAFAAPFIYTEAKKAQQEAVRDSKQYILQAWKEFGALTGREYTPLKSYMMDDAEEVFFVIGSFSEMASVAVDKMRERGEKVGLLSLKLWRPFPTEELKEALRGKQLVAVLDRSLSPGTESPLFTEVRSSIYDMREKTRVIGFIGGLGGRELSPDDFEQMMERARTLSHNGFVGQAEMIGVRD